MWQVDAHHAQVRQRLRFGVGLDRFVDGDPELAGSKPCRNVGMGLRIDVRVHTEGHRCSQAEFTRARVEAAQLGARLDVEHADSRSERRVDLVVALADSGVDDAAGVGARAKGTEQLAAAGDVGAGAFGDERSDHREVHVRLERVADRHPRAGERSRQGAVARPQLAGAVDVGRRADGLANADEGDVFGVEYAAASFEGDEAFAGHGSSSSSGSSRVASGSGEGAVGGEAARW